MRTVDDSQTPTFVKIPKPFLFPGTRWLNQYAEPVKSAIFHEKWLLRRIFCIAVLATGVMIANPFLAQLAFDLYAHGGIAQAVTLGGIYIAGGHLLEAATKLFHGNSFRKLMEKVSRSTYKVASARRLEADAEHFERVPEADIQAVEADMDPMRYLAACGDRKSFNTARLLATGFSLLFISPLAFGFFVVAGSVQWALLARKLRTFSALGPDENAARSDVNWVSRERMSKATIQTAQNMLITESVRARAVGFFDGFMDINLRGWKIQQGMEALTLLGMGVITAGVFVGGVITGAPAVALLAASAFVLKSTALLGQLVIDEASAQLSIRASKRIARVCGFPVERAVENRFSKALKRVFAVSTVQADLSTDVEKAPEQSKRPNIYIDPSRVTGYAFRDVTTKRKDHRSHSDPFRCALFTVQDLGIIGANGSGKTALAAVISGQALPYSGRVEVLTATGRYDLAQLSDRAVDENVLYIGRDTKLVLSEALKGVNFEVLAKKLRKTGFNEQKIEQIKRGDRKLYLSSGEERRVLLALMTERPIAPSLMIFDEPETGIDPGRLSDVEFLVERGTDSVRPMRIVITHNPMMLRLLKSDSQIGDNIVMLNANGGILEMAGVEALQTTTSPLTPIRLWVDKARGPNDYYLSVSEKEYSAQRRPAIGTGRSHLDLII